MGLHPTETSAPDRAASTDARRHPHWDVRHGFSNFSFLIVGNALSAALSFLNIWLSTRALGASGYGGLAAVMAAAQAVLLIAVNWTAISLVRFGTQEFVERGRLAESFWTRGAVAAATLLALGVLYPWWSGFLLSRYHLAQSQSLLLVAFIGSTAITIQIQYAMQAAKRPRDTAAMQVVERALVSAALLALLWGGSATLTAVVFAYVGGAVAAALLGVFLLRGLLLPLSVSRSMARRMLQFSVPLVANGIVGYLSSNFIDAYFLLKYLPVAALGVYTVGFQYAGALMQPATLAGTLLLPFFVTQLANGREDRIQRYFAHALPTISVAWSLVCVTAGWIGATVLPHLLGDQFREIGRVVWPLVIASAVAGPVLLGLGSLAAAQNVTYRAALASALAATANVVLDILWIPRFGMAGSAWATATAYGSSALVWVLLSRRTCTPLGIVLGIMPAAVAAIFCGLGMGNGSIFLAAVATATAVGLTWRSNWAEDWRLMREAWERSA